MIPVRLELRNFLSYRDPDPVDFRAFDVACLSGPNGVGKSSLVVDAITWALFGAARGCEGGQNQDRLIHEGTDEMWVDLTFELGGTTYRVLRRRTRSGRAELRFEVLTADGWTNLAADTIRETDARIGHELRMDYRTFVTSTFFLQGRAEDFLARMKPEDRKEVFARLLDLEAFERLEAAAKDRARGAERSRAELAERAERLREASEDPGELRAQLERAREGATRAAEELRAAEHAAQVAAAAVAEVEKQEALLERERRALDEERRRLEREQREVSRRRAELDELTELLGRRSEAQEALEELERVRAQEVVYRRAREEAHGIEKQIGALGEQVDAERRALETTVGECAERIANLDAEQRSLAGSADRLREVEAALVATDQAAEDAVQIRGELEGLQEAEARLREREQTLGTQLAEVEEKLRLVGRGKGACPLCGSALDAAHRRELTERLRAERDALEADRAGANGELEVATKEVRRLREDLSRAEGALREREELMGARERLRSQADRHRALVRSADEERERLEGAEAALRSGTFAAEPRARIEVLGERLAALYDPSGHRSALARIEELSTFERLHHRIATAEARRQVLSAEIRTADERCEEAGAAIAAHQRAVAELAEAVSGAPELRRDRDHARQAVGEHREALESAQATLVRLAGRLEVAERVAAEVEETLAEERTAASEHRRHAWLARAFGRGGIPDRIIENAVPELQDEANEILGRLSDHEMSLHFQMSRDTRSGKVRETFDVLVHQDGGVRDFQMFSGGEAFRIAFAVRLGLSKLLVRRSGARLETLVIDEGFGTQDPEGRERLVEAIELARSEFAKVLVITHLEELRDAFGTQIRVVKDPERGSVVEVCGEHLPPA